MLAKVLDLHPILATTSLAATLAYFTQKLGFTDGWTIDDEEAKPAYGGAKLDGRELHFLQTRDGVGGMQAYFEITDVDGFRAELHAQGAAPTEAADQFYGMREFQVHAPGGVIVGFASKIAE